MVQTSEWGPPLWRVLHTLVEHLGRQPVPLLQIDESRAWASLLRTTEAIMPCAVCRNHYRDWRKQNPVEAFQDARAGDWLRETSRTWLWRLHEAVNRRRGLSEDQCVKAEAVEEMYKSRKSQDLQQDLDILLEVLKRGAMQRLLDGAHLLEWRRKLAFLRKLIGF